MNKLFSKGIAVIIVCCYLLSVALGQDSHVIEIRTIGIPPYGIQGDNTASGIYYDTANQLASKTGYKANNYIYPYARIIHELKSGRTDMTIMFKYKELEDHVIYIAPLPALQTVVVGLKGSHFDSLESLKGMTLAYLRGAKFGDAIDNNSDIFKVVTTDFEQGIKMLERRRVDAIIGPLDPIISAIVRTNHDLNIFAKPLIVDERTPWVQISKKSTERISADKLKMAFDEMVRLGELDNIREKYVDSSHSNLQQNEDLKRPLLKTLE